jgi:hypothetical protein
MQRKNLAEKTKDYGGGITQDPTIALLMMIETFTRPTKETWISMIACFLARQIRIIAALLSGMIQVKRGGEQDASTCSPVLGRTELSRPRQDRDGLMLNASLSSSTQDLQV